MKKILLLAMLLFSAMTYAQDTFVRKYNSYIITKNDIAEPEESVELTVVFNPNKKKEVKFYYSDGRILTFYQTSEVKDGATDGGYEYQLINVIDEEDGEELILQLFDKDNTLRIISIKGNSTIEFYN
jgi:hypothetical protein